MDVVGHVLGTVEEIGQAVYPLLAGIHDALVITLQDTDSVGNAHLTAMATTDEGPGIDDVRRIHSPFARPHSVIASVYLY